MEQVHLQWPDPDFEEKIKDKPRLNRMVELARKHVVEGGVMAAGVYYRMILKDTSPPKTGVDRLAHAEACVWYARWAIRKGRLGEAADWFNQAISADPLAPDLYSEFVLKCLLPMGMIKEAKFYADRCAQIDPDSDISLHLIGGLEHKVGNAAASIAAYDRQVMLYPDSATAALDRATIALDTADYATVRAMSRKALGTDRHADALHCLAMADYREGKHESAIDLYDQAIAAGCYDPALARWNKSLALHSIGRYVEGWAEHENREKQVTDSGMASVMKRFKLPRWQGEPAPCSLHLHQEMGMGDAIVMVRYAPLLADRGYDVRLEVNESLAGLFRRSFPAVMVQPRAINYPGAFGVAPFDYHCPMLSLPAILGTDIDTIPWNGPYLKSSPELAKKYQALLPPGRRVGFCWSSGLRTEGIWLAEYGRRKSMHFDVVMPLVTAIEEAGMLAVNLQVGPERAQHEGRVFEALPAEPNWDDTAAVIANLDLVVTVDTAVAHLAGALGRPTWLMMQQDGASFHFMTERPGAPWNKASPWYPSVRIFRQHKPWDWDSVVSRIAQELERCPP
jgi:hypothetical protein